VAAANDGWERIAEFYGTTWEAEHVHLRDRHRPLEGSAKGPEGSWFHVTDGTVYFDHPVHAMAEHTLNIDFADPVEGARARGSRSSSPQPQRAISWRQFRKRSIRLPPS
jgi:hypothetical protein